VEGYTEQATDAAATSKSQEGKRVGRIVLVGLLADPVTYLCPDYVATDDEHWASQNPKAERRDGFRTAYSGSQGATYNSSDRPAQSSCRSFVLRLTLRFVAIESGDFSYRSNNRASVFESICSSFEERWRTPVFSGKFKYRLRCIGRIAEDPSGLGEAAKVD
jgi:hypothetical protein